MLQKLFTIMLLVFSLFSLIFLGSLPSFGFLPLKTCYIFLPCVRLCRWDVHIRVERLTSDVSATTTVCTCVFWTSPPHSRHQRGFRRALTPLQTVTRVSPLLHCWVRSMVAYKPENRFRLLLATDFDVLHSKRVHPLVKEWPKSIFGPIRYSVWMFPRTTEFVVALQPSESTGCSELWPKII
jgi:hypothetical protein